MHPRQRLLLTFAEASVGIWRGPSRSTIMKQSWSSQTPRANGWCLPAGTVLAVDTVEQFDTDGDVEPADPSQWVGVIAYVDGTVAWWPTEVGSIGEGEADDLSGLPLLTAEEVKSKHPEFSEFVEETEEAEQEEREWREQEERERERERELETLDEVAEKHGRLSLAFYRAVKRRPVSALLVDVVELPELYDDESLTQAAREHPDGAYYGPDAVPAATSAAVSVAKSAANGAIARMLVAEVMIHPGSRQVDLFKGMGLETVLVNGIAYQMRRAGVFDSTKVNGRVVLAPGEHCADFGLDKDGAGTLIASRTHNPDDWSRTIDNARRTFDRARPKFVAPSMDGGDFDDYGYSGYR